MPTYEYLCKNCGQQFEVFQSFSAKPLKKHDVCGGEVQKVFHARGVVFKGSGFYVTDSKSPKTSAKSSSGSDSGGKSDSGGRSDSGGKADSGGKSESGGKSDSGSEGKSDSKPKSDSKSKTESSRSSSSSSRSDD